MNKDLLNQIKEIKNDKGNFQTLKKIIGEERLKEFINSIYPKFAITEIETITGIPHSTLEYWFNKLKIPFIRNHIRTKSFPSNLDSEIVVTKDAITYRSTTIKITPELAYIIGFTLGDGSVQQYMVEVFNKDRNLRKIIWNYLKPYGTITREERKDGLWRLRLSSRRIANLIKNENQIREDTINYIFNNNILARNFIAAFWDAEGSVNLGKHNYYHIYLYNSNSYLLGKIYNFLKSKNIKFSISNLKSRTNLYLLNGMVVTPKKMVQRISIPKSSCLVWVNEIGKYMNHTKKKQVINEIIKCCGGNQND